MASHYVAGLERITYHISVELDCNFDWNKSVLTFPQRYAATPREVIELVKTV